MLVVSCHTPCTAGPTPIVPQGQNKQYLLPYTRTKQTRFLKSFENCYLSRIKITPIIP